MYTLSPFLLLIVHTYNVHVHVCSGRDHKTLGLTLDIHFQHVQC